MSRTLRSLLPLLAIVVFSSCAGDGPFVPKIETTNFDPALGVNLATSIKTASGLYYRDITVGSGPPVPATPGTSVTASYVGYLRNGVIFDSGILPPFVTGSGTLIAGFDEGVRGMRAGGQRQLIIPPALGYGSQGVGSVPPNSILVFVVTLISINN